MTNDLSATLIIVADDMDEDRRCITTQERIDADKVPIATVETGWTGPIENEQMYYLRLFSAAPDLYEALIRVTGALIEHAPHEQETIQRAQFAISKAESQAPAVSPDQRED